ncbi:hypothetical protein ABTZ46_10410 [Nocardioides sp. NPDC126508]
MSKTEINSLTNGRTIDKPKNHSRMKTAPIARDIAKLLDWMPASTEQSL